MALTIGMLVFPDVTQLDLTGPYEVLARVPDATIHLVWKTLDPVRSDRGLLLQPTCTMDECPPLDVICVPGGPGQVDLMADDRVLDFLRRIAPGCRYVTSVCTGALVLGAAGLLKGLRATTYWAAHDQLRVFGATPVACRVVIDGNRITGGGVTSGIDFALTLAAELAGEEMAKSIQLAMEYDPAPPFDAGTPDAAGEAVTMQVMARTSALRDRRLAATIKAAERL